MKLLIISLAGNGDTLFSTPLIHELRANYPDATIDVLVRWPGAKGLFEGNPYVNTVYQKDLQKVGLTEALKFLKQLRSQHYDVSINTHPQSRVHYRAVARFIGAPVRLSHEYDHHWAIDELLVTRTLPQDYQRHSVENNLALLSLLDAKPTLPVHGYELYLSETEHVWADEFLASKGLASRQSLGMHIGSGGTKNLALRRWPLDSFGELIHKLQTAHPDWAILLFGGPEEERDHARLLEKTGHKALFEAKTSTLRHAAALIKRCALFLSVDTVMMHLAAATKVPKQIVIETPTWNKPIEPYGNPFILVKNPSLGGDNLEYYRYNGRGIRGTAAELARCMRGVTVEAVLEALMG